MYLDVSSGSSRIFIGEQTKLINDMNKVIAIGDIHGSTLWRDIVEENKDAIIVFMGDYLDPYEEYDCDGILDNLADIIDFKCNNRERVILLLGNHDLHYFIESANISTRYDSRIAKRARLLFNDNCNLFQYAYQVNRIIFTHAGISQKWFDNDFKGNISHNIAEQLNNPKDEQIEALYRVGTKRGGDDGCIGGIFWADRSELTDPLHGFTQVVGHNRVNDITKLVYFDDNRIIFCDCLNNGKYFKINI